MKKIRIGTTLRCIWAISSEGESLDFSKYKKTEAALLDSSYRTATASFVYAENGCVLCTFQGTEQVFTGVYFIRLTLTNHDGSTRTIDSGHIFNLVPTTSMADCSASNGTAVVECVSEAAVGVAGASAYELWLQQSSQKGVTDEKYLEYLGEKILIKGDGSEPFSDINDILATLDGMHGTNSEEHGRYLGNWKAYLGKRYFNIYVTVEEYSTDTWSQEITMPFNIYYKEEQNPDNGNEFRGDQIFYNENGDVVGGYYHSKYSPTFEASQGRTQDENGDPIEKGLFTYRRRCIEGVWGDWYDVSNPYAQSPLFGKKIAIYGGSYAQNTYSKDGFGFNYKGKAYSLNNYIAQMLGAKRVDNYAVGGNGHASVFPYNTRLQIKASIKGDTGFEGGFIYDVYIIMCGINDYKSNVPINDMLNNLKDGINLIRSHNNRAVIYMTTPFKSYWKDSNWGWNVNTATKNSLGLTFTQYNQALRDFACDNSIPMFDIFVQQGFGSANMESCYYEADVARNNGQDVVDSDGALLVDLIHPNGLGYRLISNSFINFIATGIGNNTPSLNMFKAHRDELLARIKGESSSSNASTDPFKLLPVKYDNSDFYALIDETKEQGVYRGFWGKEMYNLECVDHNGTIVQCIRGNLNINTDGELIISSGRYRYLRRFCYEDKWSKWEVIADAINTPSAPSSYGRKVILLGDSQVALCKSPNYSLEGLLKSKLNTEVYNFAFAGSRWAYRTDNVAYNAFSVLNVLSTLCDKDTSSMDNNVGEVGDDCKEDYSSTLNKLKSFLLSANMGDGSEWVIVIAAGGNDFGGKTPLTEGDAYTLYGAMSLGLSALSAKYPAMLIHVVSPTFRMMKNADGDDISSDIYTHRIEPIGQMTRWQYGDKIIEYAQDMLHLPAYDMYRKGGRNEYNIVALCPDGVHPTSDIGVKVTSDIYDKILKSF
jgi:lysophospholipase L1-like esterase